MIEHAIAKNQFATIVIGRSPGDLLIDSSVISVIIASDGERIRFDAEDRPHAGEGGRHAGERMTSDAREGGRAERHEDQVAGVGRHAREDPDQDQDEGEQGSGRDLDELPDEGAPSGPRLPRRPRPFIAMNVMPSHDAEAGEVGGRRT